MVGDQGIHGPSIKPTIIKIKKKNERSHVELGGIKKKGVTSFLRNLISEHKFHFIGLQETMQGDISDQILRNLDPMNNYLWKWISSRVQV